MSYKDGTGIFVTQHGFIFEKFSSDRDRISYFAQKFDEIGVYDKILEQIDGLDNEKNEVKSEEVRLRGNIFYNDKDYISALKCYNASICYAPLDSLHIAKGYFNRSGVMLQLKHYEYCFKDIELAKSVKTILTEDLSEQLVIREILCVRLQAEDEDRLDDDDENNFDFEKEFVLSYPPHPDIPYIADCLEIRNTPDTGRGVFTKRELKPGDLVAIDDFFSSTANQNSIYSICHNCSSENYYHLFPCSNCPLVMYCSVKCQEEDATFHQIECRIRKIFTAYFDAQYNVDLGLKITIKILAENNYDFEKCYENVKMFKKTNDFNRIIANEYLTKRSSIGINNLEPQDPTNDGFYGIPVIVNHFIKENTPFGAQYLVDNGNNENIFRELFLHYLLIACRNCFGCSVLNTFFLNFASYVNHSCMPNSTHVQKNGKQFFFTTKRIQKGDELSITYGPMAWKGSVISRKSKISAYYRFNCKCYACLHDMKGTEIDTFSSNPDFAHIYFNSQKFSNNPTNMRDLLEKCCAYIERFGPINVLNADVNYVENQIGNCVRKLAWPRSISKFE